MSYHSPRVFFFLASALILFSADARAQDAQAISRPTPTIYEIHSGIGLPQGWSIGTRILPWQSLGFEVAVGTEISDFTFTLGADFPSPSPFEGIQPSWSFLGTYFKGADAKWYVLSGEWGILQTSIEGLHAFGRFGASLLFKNGVNGILVYPLPAFDFGLAWTFSTH